MKQHRVDEMTRVRNLADLFDRLPEDQRILLDVLRQIILEHLPAGCREKIAFNVPYFHARRGICILWPAAIPRGGIKEGVLLGFWHGRELKDEDRYLTRGTNRQVYYRIYKTVEDIDEAAIVKLLEQAVRIAL